MCVRITVRIFQQTAHKGADHVADRAPILAGPTAQPLRFVRRDESGYPDKLLWHGGIVAHPMLCILGCMTDTDRPEFFRRLGDLAKLMRHEPPMSVMEIYYRALSDLPLAAVVFGLDASATHGQHFPRPAEIRERVREERKRRYLEKSTREALAEEPGEPIALPEGHGPDGDGARQAV